MHQIMKDNNGFTRQDIDSGWTIGAGIALSILTLFGYFYLFYECSFERKYWKNRIRLWRYLRKGQVTLLEKPRRLPEWLGNTIDELKISINGTSYEIWIYRDQCRMTMRSTEETNPLEAKDFIGLFVQSPILKRINRKTIQRLDRLHVGKYK
jgi:hypothetical protein